MSGDGSAKDGPAGGVYVIGTVAFDSVSKYFAVSVQVFAVDLVVPPPPPGGIFGCKWLGACGLATGSSRKYWILNGLQLNIGNYAG